MRGRTIASFGQAFPCWAEAGGRPPSASDSGVGVDAITELEIALSIADGGTGMDGPNIVVHNQSKRGLVTLGPRSFTIKADMQ